MTIELGAPAVLSRLRVWNYNASRAHAQRGGRHAELRLDGVLIWGGELRCALGYVVGSAEVRAHSLIAC